MSKLKLHKPFRYWIFPIWQKRAISKFIWGINSPQFTIRWSTKYRLYNTHTI